ncbi:NERD domain-containing protein [Chengkuizengella marina]|uniref:NERD domain-containing protein n=1 Tax=Chengkuizengella marina TaxID=2507566 RepID=UPI00136D9D39|nr:NERD domain-containing protein [Chengkuizengella marina]
MELITEVIHYIFIWLTDLGYWGIMIGLMIEVIPSEIILSYGGFLIYQNKITWTEAMVFATIGGTLAQIFLYWLGKFGGRPLIEKYGKYILIHKKHLDLSEKWFNQYGTGMIFTARFIPVVRHAISIPAGLANMSFIRFSVLTTLAVIPWSAFFLFLGTTLGENWEQIDEKAQPFVMPFIIVSLLLTGFYLIYKITKKKDSSSQNYGLEGEKIVKHQLKYLPKGYTVFHDIKLKTNGRTQQFDHVAIGPNGIFHIETKHWSGEIRFTSQGIQRSNNKNNVDPTAQMYRHDYIIKELLRRNNMKTSIRGLICFSHPNCQIIGESPAFKTIKVDRLLHTIQSYKTKRPVSKEEMKRLSNIIEHHLVS